MKLSSPETARIQPNAWDLFWTFVAIAAGVLVLWFVLHGGPTHADQDCYDCPPTTEPETTWPDTTSVTVATTPQTAPPGSVSTPPHSANQPSASTSSTSSLPPTSSTSPSTPPATSPSPDSSSPTTTPSTVPASSSPAVSVAPPPTIAPTQQLPTTGMSGPMWALALVVCVFGGILVAFARRRPAGES